MESTRKWLADAIERDLDGLAGSFVRWARAAGASIDAAAGRAILVDLLAWLRRDDEVPPAPEALGVGRASDVARSAVVEHLKSSGHLGVHADDERRAREVDEILEEFFVVGPRIAIQRSSAAGTPRSPKT